MPHDASSGSHAVRADLLAALAGTFETLGYDGATLSRLAAATGLSKSSLYHHFPGGKAEMAAVLLRDAAAELERSAFARLSANHLPAGERLAAFVDGFSDYVHEGERHCLVAVLAHGSAASEHGATVASQFEEWSHRLAAAFEEAGYKSKRAERAAAELLAGLYGSLELSFLRRDPAVFRTQVKRLKKRLPA